MSAPLNMTKFVHSHYLALSTAAVMVKQSLTYEHSLYMVMCTTNSPRSLLSRAGWPKMVHIPKLHFLGNDIFGPLTIKSFNSYLDKQLTFNYSIILT